MKILKLLSVVFWMLVCLDVSGQGWVKEIKPNIVSSGDFYTTSPKDFIETKDGNFIFYWTYSNFTQIFTGLEKTTPTGKTIWQKIIPEIPGETLMPRNYDYVFEIDSGIVVFQRSEFGIVKKTFSNSGELQRKDSIDWPSGRSFFKMSKLNDDEFLLHSGRHLIKLKGNQIEWEGEIDSSERIEEAIFEENKIALLLTNSNGESIFRVLNKLTGRNIFEKRYSFTEFEPTQAIKTFGNTYVFFGKDALNEYNWIVRIDSNGEIKSKMSFPYISVLKIIPDSIEQDILFCRESRRGIGSFSVFKFSFEKNSLDEMKVNFPLESIHTDYISAQKRIGNKYFFYGNERDAIEKAVFIVTDSTFKLPIHQFTGRVTFDNDLDCRDDPRENGPTRWKLRIESPTDTTYVLTGQNGEFSTILADTNYRVSVLPPGDLWMPCEASYSIDFQGVNDSIDLFIPVQPVMKCPLMQVNIATDRLVPCERSIYWGDFSNIGTDTAFDATLEITLDPGMTVIESSIPISSQFGNTLTLNLGDVPPGEFDIFNILIEMSCDDLLPGQTHCVTAHIFPDDICDTQWQGANIEVASECKVDSVVFTLTNVGEPMLSSFNYIVIEDDIILKINDFQLDADGVLRVPHFVKTGSTYRLEADQEVDFPILLGGSPASATIEGCNAEPGSVFNTGIFTQFGLDDAEPYLAGSCIQNVIDADFREKIGFPEGFGRERLIEKEQSIEYTLSFQNNGRDTVRQVIIRDTLSRFLNINSVEPLSASHAYQFEIYNGNILKFTFENPVLPPSGENELESRGFVKFRCRPVDDIRNETIIPNSAGIYLDSALPRITNLTSHKIGEDFIDIVSTSVLEKRYENLLIKTAPNPFSESVFIELENLELNSFSYELTDVSGRQIRSAFVRGNSFELKRKDLPKGMYFITLRTPEHLIFSTLKIVCQ